MTMARGEIDMVNLAGRVEGADVQELIRILSFEHSKAVALDAAAKRDPSSGTKHRAALLTFVRAALIRAGRIDIWNSALETMPFNT